MPKYILHPQTVQQLEAMGSRPPHAVLVAGQPGIGKATVAITLAEQALNLAEGKLATYPYARHIRPVDNKAIGIENIRELEHFLSLKIPGSKPISRVVIIEDAHLMTTESQNALLKQLEEPPADTVIILTSAHEQALLPTIRSRVQTLMVKKPGQPEVMLFFAGRAAESEVKQAVAISGGLPGLTAAMLSGDEAHPLMEAVSTARHLLQATPYERMLKVDDLAKQREASRDMCFVLMQMAHTAIANGSPSPRWQNILQAAYTAQEQLLASGQPKLVLSNLMLNL
ncbi:MAG TPA: AAA family ATPase [Candidatus Saccharimonadales bacterium]|nr:AAA family ATPase [Candidatus Saccharimonadales bacterium]